MRDELSTFVREIAADALESGVGKAVLEHRMRAARIAALAGDDDELRARFVDRIAGNPEAEAALGERALDELDDDFRVELDNTTRAIYVAQVVSAAQHLVGALDAAHVGPDHVDPATVAALVAAWPRWKDDED